MGIRGLGRLYLPRYRPRGGGPSRKSSVWWWRYGKHAISTGCRDIRDAEAWRIQRLAEMGRGSLVGVRAQALTYDDMQKMLVDTAEAKGLRSIRCLRARVKYLSTFFMGYRAQAISTVEVTAYVAARRRAGAAVGTINLELSHLRRMFRLAVVSKRLLHENVPEIQELPGAHVRRDVPADADLDAIVSRMPEYQRPAVECLWLTGWRKSEVLCLEWARVDFDRQEIKLYDSKTGDPRTLSWARYPELGELMTRQRDGQRAAGVVTPWVFATPSGNRITSSNIGHGWRGARAASGIIAAEGPFLHGLRRRLCKDGVDANIDPRDIMEITGHKTLKTFYRYAIRTQASQEAATSKLSDFRARKLPAESKIAPFKKTS